MGGEQAASVLATVRRDNIEAEGKTWSAGRGGGVQGADPRRSTRREGNPYYATARLWDDGIILPSETRRVLALAFSRGAQRAGGGDAVRRVPDVTGWAHDNLGTGEVRETRSEAVFFLPHFIRR